MSPPADSTRRDAEAARYALLRRLAPSMRHHLVVNLQPIGMIYEVMDRRLRAAEPDLAHVRDSAGKINGFAKSALASCIDVVGWLAPDEGVGIGLVEGTRECCALLATSLGFRGYALRNEIDAGTGKVRRAALRSLLPAAMLHCTDQHPSPADLRLAAEVDAETVRIAVTLRPGQGDKGIPAEVNYRKLEWSDLEALAAVEGVHLDRTGDGLVLRFPRLPD